MLNHIIAMTAVLLIMIADINLMADRFMNAMSLQAKSIGAENANTTSPRIVVITHMDSSSASAITLQARHIGV